ncbi:hypothetical protein NDU88_002885 [Pleurodeles waltl]|uniref:Uncharacterized protein n=1 Tax=Pleurodeles waltl TaxID=8319 RepID=A0AAV7T3T6_PLEWA|nr:hypothetical protein NDU88_002885 [Pleurodeles waltl]
MGSGCAPLRREEQHCTVKGDLCFRGQSGPNIQRARNRLPLYRPPRGDPRAAPIRFHRAGRSPPARGSRVSPGSEPAGQDTGPKAAAPPVRNITAGFAAHQGVSFVSLVPWVAGVSRPFPPAGGASARTRPRTTNHWCRPGCVPIMPRITRAPPVTASRSPDCCPYRTPRRRGLQPRPRLGQRTSALQQLPAASPLLGSQRALPQPDLGLPPIIPVRGEPMPRGSPWLTLPRQRLLGGPIQGSAGAQHIHAGLCSSISSDCPGGGSG